MEIRYLGYFGDIDASCNWILRHLRDAAADGASEIVLALCSPGGNTNLGLAIHYGIVAMGLSLTVHNVANVDSAAVPIFLGGTKRLASPHATFLIHGPKMELNGNYGRDAMLEKASILRRDEQALLTLLTNRSHATKRQIDAWLRSGRMLTAKEALAYGLIHEIAPFAPPAGSLKII